LDNRSTLHAVDRINATAACVLGLLILGPAPGQPGFGEPEPAMTGSQLWRAAATSIARFWNITRSQVFRELPRMQALGLVEPSAPGARRQQPYRITPSGRTAFSAWLTQFVENGLRDEQMHSPLVLAVFFGELAPRGALRAALQADRDRHAQRLHTLERMAQALGDAKTRLPSKTVSRGIAYQQLTLDWIDTVLESIQSSARS
jgi:DNA-binding PadR family transcriptional regulator